MSQTIEIFALFKAPNKQMQKASFLLSSSHPGLEGFFSLQAAIQMLLEHNRKAFLFPRGACLRLQTLPVIRPLFLTGERKRMQGWLYPQFVSPGLVMASFIRCWGCICRGSDIVVPKTGLETHTPHWN